MIIKTTCLACYWYKDLKEDVEPTLSGVKFSTYEPLKSGREYIQVEIATACNEDDKKTLFLMELKRDFSNAQELLDGIAAYALDKFGCNISDDFKVEE